MDDNGKPTPEAAFGDALPERPDMAPPPPVAEAPDWIMTMVRKIIWRVVIVLLVTALLIVMALKARNLLSMLFIAGFFGIAMEPAVNHLHMKRGMKRGAATGLVFVVSATFLLVLVFVMIPGLVAVAGELSNSLKGAIPKINDQFGTTFPTSKTDPAF
ncbi:MAG: AI-2E family transporter, partial [Actinobacteria bacterium]|nr:AI-2E family transporter [Actinomycetota bacterium]